jgi:NADH oxidase (H2O-forming)
MGKTVDITKDVKWIGIQDSELVTFDIVMETKYGTTYNSYFINAEKKAVVDTAKETYKDEYLSKVCSVTDPGEIDFIILNHTEPDHSGSLKHLLKIAPGAKVIGSRQAIHYLNEMVNEPFEYCYVKDGDTIDLGNKTLRFISAPNLHWPDSIYTYLEEDRLLFTCDSFGAHFCHENIFDDEVGDYSDAFSYYFDVILKPFSKFLLKAIEKIRPLEIDMICPGHGPVLRKHWKEIVDISEEKARDYLKETADASSTVMIAYVSAYGFTKRMAESIAKGIRSIGSHEVELVDIEHILPGDLEEKITRSKAMLIGSPTINQNTLLPVYKMFALINPIRDKGKPAASFGSYGWSGEAVKVIENQLKNLKLNVVQDGLASKFNPDDVKLSETVEFGKSFAKHLQ